MWRSFFHFVAASLQVGIAAIACVPDCLAQGRPTGPAPTAVPRGKTIVWNDTAERPAVYSILGSVGRPGVYVAENKSCTLQRLVRDAQGLSTNASALIRIVRAGRAGERVQFDPSAETPLLPGDIAIADEIHGSHALDAPRPDAVWVAFVGVSETPVVVKLRPEHAFLESIVGMLSQPAETMRSVRVIPGQGTVDKTGRISNGSVLLFDPRTIQKDRLPAFPESIKLTALYEVKTIENVAGVQESDPRKIVQPDGIDFGAGRFPPNAVSTRTRPQATSLGEPTMVLPEPYVRSTTISRPAEFGVPADLAPSPALSGMKVPSQTASLPHEMPSEPVTTALAPKHESTEFETPEPAVEQPVTPLSAFQMFMILCSVAGLVTLALVARRVLERDRMDGNGLAATSFEPQIPIRPAIRTEAEQLASSQIPSGFAPRQPAPMAKSILAAGQPVHGLPIDIFESLIRNELPIADEAASLHESIELQGTPIPLQSHRADAAHAIADEAPHFWKIMKNPQEQPELMEAISPTLKPADDAGDDPFSASTFERALHRLKGGLS